MPDKRDVVVQPLHDVVINLEWLPSPNPNLCRILSLMHNMDSDIRQIEELLQADPGLSSQVLRFANSSFYGMRGGIHDIKKAILVLGTREIQNICLTVALLQQFRNKKTAPSFSNKSFWHHSILTAMLSAELTRRYAPTIPREEMYILGLLHDIGRLAMAVYLPDLFEKTLSKPHAGIYEAEKAVGVTHCQVGHILAKKWGMPEVFAAVILLHHEPQNATTHILETALVAMAEHLSNSDTATNGPRPTQLSAVIPSSCKDVAALLHISEENYIELLNTLPDINKKAQDMLKQFI